MLKKLFFLILVFAVGGAGGLFLPVLIGRWWSDAPFLPQNQTVIVNRMEQVVLAEKEALERAYRMVAPALVTVRASKSGGVQASGNGFVVSSDGFVLTRTEWVGEAFGIVVEHSAGEAPARVVETSAQYGLALLKVDASNLPVVSFAGDVPQRIGTTAFLLGVKRGASGRTLFVNSGIIKSVDGRLIETTIEEEFAPATGTPLVSLDGSVMGINSVNSTGRVFAISSDAIKEFLQ